MLPDMWLVCWYAVMSVRVCKFDTGDFWFTLIFPFWKKVHIEIICRNHIISFQVIIVMVVCTYLWHKTSCISAIYDTCNCVNCICNNEHSICCGGMMKGFYYYYYYCCEYIHARGLWFECIQHTTDIDYNHRQTTAPKNNNKKQTSI